ncbi:MAG: helix-turn-helix domain-containing protein [Deltaproteobacteria bacterium]|nr:helix-turn-helix domain-containing protein [Deltaproteobacteria bacterium]
MRQFGDEAFYTPEQVAKRLQVSLTTLYNLIKAREIPAVRIGKSFRIPESELERRLHITSKGAVVPKIVRNFVDRLQHSALAKKVTDVILFGSYARGEPDEDSDIDMLVLHRGLSPTEEVAMSDLEEAAAAATGYADDLQIMKWTIERWNTLANHRAGIVRTIQTEGISLWKNRHPQNRTG